MRRCRETKGGGMKTMEGVDEGRKKGAEGLRGVRKGQRNIGRLEMG